MKKSKKEEQWEENLTLSGVKLSAVTPGPGTYRAVPSRVYSNQPAFSFGQHKNNEVKIRLGYDPASDR